MSEKLIYSCQMLSLRTLRANKVRRLHFQTPHPEYQVLNSARKYQILLECSKRRKGKAHFQVEFQIYISTFTYRLTPQSEMKEKDIKELYLVYRKSRNQKTVLLY